MRSPPPRPWPAARARSGLPQPKLAGQVSGVFLVLASALPIIGVWPDLAAIALVPFLLITAFVFHDFWRQETPEARQEEMIQFNKDLSLAGGAMAPFVPYASDHYPGLSLVGSLFT